MSGKVSYADVEYCTKSQKFVNVSPSEASATTVGNKKSSCTAAQKAACKKAGVSCTKGKGASKSTATGTSNVKLVKQEN